MSVKVRHTGAYIGKNIIYVCFKDILQIALLLKSDEFNFFFKVNTNRRMGLMEFCIVK